MTGMSLTKHVVQLWKRNGAYTFSLFLSFLFVTFGTVVLVMIVWYGSAGLGYFSLREAAKSAALAAQSQVEQVDVGSGTGFLTAANWFLLSSYQSAANSLFQKQVMNMRLNQVFTGLTCQTTAKGNQIVVDASGSYLPLFLQTLAQRFPQITAVSIPMKVEIGTEYTVVGG